VAALNLPMTDSMHKDDLRRLATLRKRRNAQIAKAAVAVFGLAAVGAWAFLVAT